MKKISGFFISTFKIDELSEERLLKFASDHIRRLHEINTHGQLDKMIQETQSAVSQLHSLRQKNMENKMYVSVSSRSMSDLCSSFTEIANRLEGLVKAHYGRKSSKYKSIFPNGLTMYTKANKSTIWDLCLQLQFFADSINGSLPEELRNEISTFSINLKAQLKNHNENNKEKKCLKDMKYDAKERVSKQLHKNLLLIAAENIGKPEVSEIYFDQSLLERMN